MGRTYVPPAGLDLSQVVNLLPDFTNNTELKPETLVYVKNRGPKTLTDMHNANPYVMPPYALCQMTYGAAVHLQRRLIVPGTRNPNPQDVDAPQYVSWLGIPGVDPEEACEEFTPAFLEKYADGVEGLNRDLLPSADRSVVVARTADLRRALPGTGVAPSQAVAGDGGGGLNQQIVGGSDDAREAALAPVEGSDASAASAAAIASGWTPPDTASVESSPAPSNAPPVPRIGRDRRGR